MSAAAIKAGRGQAAAARVGRPPSVTVPQIVAVALELGLDNLSLKQVADRLGVGLATLYRHVGTRDELLRLASFELMLRRQAPVAESAHWSEVARQYAETLLQSFLAEPQLITELQRGRLGPHAEVDLLEQFLGTITQHGFSIDEGVRLFHAIGTLVVGTATGMAGHRASEAAGESWKLETRRVLGARDDDELPMVRRAYPQFIEPGVAQWQFAVRSLLAGVAAARGEELPADLLTKPAAARAVSIQRKGSGKP
jgi:AcrR family transcriptional regulator